MARKDSDLHDCSFAPSIIGNETRAERGEPGATSHGGNDTSLDIRARTLAVARTLVEAIVAAVGVSSDTARMLVRLFGGDEVGCATHMALMELISKPKRPPPMMEMAAMR